ncbi:helix-turn-helix domain-containing protein [Rummeliibacillus pycnus]|uniref:helix-turn-helix domain-containing protein n=1 Tax=Rummeliibacillus pycnus TaxID=101070 RepID=UPI000C9B28FB|nr:helix-turn-helix domain-containing protein [Rummeliibacillus pycnus]
MVGTILAILFIAQLLSFYFIILLYTKINRLREVEKSQQQLKDEMDNAVGAYLAEMRDENNRLIKELTLINSNKPIEENMNMHKTKENNTNEVNYNQFSEEEVIVPTFNTPRNVATKAYKNSSIAPQNAVPHIVEKSKQLTLHEQIQELYRSGKTIDEIAKMLQKGKTEIELLLKFQH